MILALTVGSIVLMWLGELITEKGIGNGISFIIFAGIVSRVPDTVGQFLAQPRLAASCSVFGMVGILIIFVIIFVQEGQRRIPIQYANRVRGHRIYQGGSTFLPLRVNMSGVIPIIFAISILLFPLQIAHVLLGLRRSAGSATSPRASSRAWTLRGPLYLSLVLPADPGVRLLLHVRRVQAGRDGQQPAQVGRLHTRHPAGQPDRGLPASGGPPDHRGRRHVRGRGGGPADGHRRVAAVLEPRARHRRGSGRHQRPDRRQRRRRDDEATRGAADDAQLRGLHR